MGTYGSALRVPEWLLSSVEMDMPGCWAQLVCYDPETDRFETVADLAGGMGPNVVLVALMVLSSLLSQALDGARDAAHRLARRQAMIIDRRPSRMGIHCVPVMCGSNFAEKSAMAGSEPQLSG